MRKQGAKQINLAGYLFISPWLIGFFLFTFLPIAASFFLAFSDYNLLAAPEWVGWANFERLFFRDVRFWRAVKVTFFYVVTAVPLRLAFALAVAMLLNTSRRLIPTYRAMYYAPSIVGGSVAVAVMWRQIFGKDGMLSLIFDHVFGVPHFVMLGNPKFAIWTLIILAAWQFGSPMLIFLAGLKQIPTELYESASIDGAGRWAKFLKITIPLLTPVIFFNLVMQMINGFLVFTQAFIVSPMGSGAPLDKLLLYALYLYQRAFVTHEMGYSAAMAWVLLVVIACFTALLFKSSSRWVYYETK